MDDGSRGFRSRKTFFGGEDNKFNRSSTTHQIHHRCSSDRHEVDELVVTSSSLPFLHSDHLHRPPARGKHLHCCTAPRRVP